MAIEPINRDDGRHWCNPASADPGDSPVECPDCGRIWVYDGENTWAEPHEESAGEMLDDPFEDIVFEESAGD
jgi:hypothetical protein